MTARAPSRPRRRTARAPSARPARWRSVMPLRPLRRQAISRSIAGQGHTIRIPVHMIEITTKIVRTSRQMLNEIGREPTPEELAEKLGMPLEKVRKVLKIAKEPLSLETPIGDE